MIERYFEHARIFLEIIARVKPRFHSLILNTVYDYQAIPFSSHRDIGILFR